MRGLLLVAENGWMNDRVFDLDAQLLVDAIVVACSIFVLFLFLSYLLFNPARELLRKRREYIQDQLDTAARDKEEGQKFKSEYDARLKNIDKESEMILSDARKKALKRENEIVDEAKQQAGRILDRTNREIELEKVKARDEVKQEMISVASVMAGKIIGTAIDAKKQAELIDDTLKEMGDTTWQS